MSRFLAMDIGCLECGEDSRAIGLFDTAEAAQAALAAPREEQAKGWHGEHWFAVFDMSTGKPVEEP